MLGSPWASVASSLFRAKKASLHSCTRRVTLLDLRAPVLTLPSSMSPGDPPVRLDSVSVSVGTEVVAAVFACPRRLRSASSKRQPRGAAALLLVGSVSVPRSPTRRRRSQLALAARAPAGCNCQIVVVCLRTRGVKIHQRQEDGSPDVVQHFVAQKPESGERPRTQ